MKYLLLLIPLLLAGCSGVNYDEQTKLQIAELQKQAEVAKVACNNLEIVNNKINNLKGYLGNEGNNIAPPVVGKSDSKPILHGYDCIIDDKGSTEYREYKDSEVSYLKECGAFVEKSDCFIVNDTSENCFKQ